jgi:CheY-like chemotaxis protein
MAVTVADKPVVLIVEDHDDTREMLQLLLQVFGCRVIPAHDGEEAMSLAEKSIPDLILMDMRMPHIDGLTVTRLIRSHPTLNETPIVAMTGMATPQFRSDVLSAGCNDCLYKPIDFDRLEELIKTLTPRVPRHDLSSRSVITGQTW